MNKSEISGYKTIVRTGFNKFSLDYPVVYMLLAICIVMYFLNRDFYTPSNIISIFTSNSYFIVGSIGLAFVFLSGNCGIDLSVGYVISFSAIVSTKAMAALSNDQLGMNPWIVILIGVVVACVIGCAFGLLNGFVIAKFKIAPFIITLATQLLANGLCLVLTNGYTVSGAPRELAKLSTLTGIYFGKTIVPYAAIIPIILLIVMAVVLVKTTFGRQIILTGSNPEGARHAGIPVQKIYILVYLISGLFSGIAGIFVIMSMGAVNPAMGGNFLLPMVAAVTIGGISQSGGYGNMLQAGLGILSIIFLMNAMTFLGFSLSIQQIAYGIVIVFTMTLLGFIEKKRFRM